MTMVMCVITGHKVTVEALILRQHKRWNSAHSSGLAVCGVCVCVCVCVCCVCALIVLPAWYVTDKARRHRDSAVMEISSVYDSADWCVCVCVCVCERERERDSHS